jgi:hypothetical protein
MNIVRFFVAVIGVWIVRSGLNGLFYTKVVGHRYAMVTSVHPDMFRQVVPAYIVTDLIFALVFTLLFVKVGAALSDGIKGGVILGVFVGILSPVLGESYGYFSHTYIPAGLAVGNAIFQLAAHTIEGGVAGLIYKGRPKLVPLS